MDTYCVTAKLDGILTRTLADSIAAAMNKSFAPPLDSDMTLTVMVEAAPAD